VGSGLSRKEDDHFFLMVLTFQSSNIRYTEEVAQAECRRKSDSKFARRSDKTKSSKTTIWLVEMIEKAK